MAGRKRYPDLKYLFMRGLIEHERQQRTRHYLKAAAECTSKAVVSLELSDEPIRSVKQARQLEGIGGETCVKLTKLEKEHNFSTLKPVGGQFVSSAGAILVALLDATDDELLKGHSQDRPTLITEDHVRRRAVNLSEESFLDQTALGEGFCKAWWRLEVLIKRGLIRRRSYKKQPVLQLLPLGRDIAMRLRGETGITSMLPLHPALPVPPLVATSFQRNADNKTATAPWDIQGDQSVRLDDALYTNDDGKDGVVMLVDTQELGGGRVGLGDLCRLLDQTKICYKTRRLATGDYSWFWRIDGVERTLPCLIERKRADDVARTLKEGRFWSQVNKMIAWKKDFVSRGIDCSLHYILERKPEDYVVKCDDGCQGVGKCGNPTLTQVKLAIEDLKRHPELQVKFTDSIEVTVVLLSSITADLVERANKGDFDELVVKDMSNDSNEIIFEPPYNKHNKCHDYKCKTLSSVDLLSDSEDPANSGDDEELRITVKRSVENKHEVLDEKKSRRDNDTFVTLSVDSDNDDELAVVLQKSALETEPTFSSDKQNRERLCAQSSRFEKGIDTGVDKTDSDIDEELALAIERSKTDTTYNQFNDRLQDASVPLMQYHCSLSNSVTCTMQSPKKKDINVNAYRPKINRNTNHDPYSSSKLELNSRTDYLNNNCKLLSEATQQHRSRSDWDRESTATSSAEIRLHDLSRQTNKLSYSDVHISNSISDLGRIDKFSRIPFIDVDYNTSENKRDKLNHSGSTKQTVSTNWSVYRGEQNSISLETNKRDSLRKKKKMNFHLTPDKSNIEHNVMHAAVCSVKKKRKINHHLMPDECDIERVNIEKEKDKMNISTVENRSHSHSNEVDAKSVCKGAVSGVYNLTDLEFTNSDYNSDEDLFADNQTSLYLSNINRLHKASEVGNIGRAKGFQSEVDSDRSSLDSLPDIELVHTGKKDTSDKIHVVSITNSSLKEFSDQSEINAFPDISMNLRIHAACSRKSMQKGSFSESEDGLSEKGNSSYMSHQDHKERVLSGPRTKQTKRKVNKYDMKNDECIQEKIDMIIAVLPQLDREKCFWLLHRFLGSVERCIEHVLLEENNLSHGDIINLDG